MAMQAINLCDLDKLSSPWREPWDRASKECLFFDFRVFFLSKLACRKVLTSGLGCGGRHWERECFLCHRLKSVLFRRSNYEIKLKSDTASIYILELLACFWRVGLRQREKRDFSREYLYKKRDQGNQYVPMQSAPKRDTLCKVVYWQTSSVGEMLTVHWGN